MDDLLDANRVALVGPVLAELLLGFRRKDQANWVASRLRLTHYVEAGWEDWQAAADLRREMAANGNKRPLTDLVLAVVTRHCNASVYTTDPHFDLISGLKRYVPE